jgi:hypothetical protein
MATPALSRCALAAALLLIAVSAPACLEPLPTPSRVDDLRVLGVRATPPEVPPGATVSLDALVVDPQGREISYAWYACLTADLGGGFFGGGGQTSSSGGNGTPLDPDEDGSSCRLKFERGRDYAYYLGDGPTASFQVPEGILDDPEALAVAFRIPADVEIPELVRLGFLGIAGLNMTVQLTVTVDGRTVEAGKKVNVSVDSPLPDNDRNTNPEGIVLRASESDPPPADEEPRAGEAHAAGACFEGAPPEIPAGSTWYLTPLNFPAEPPTYLVLLAGSTTGEPFEVQSVTETWFYSFFATAGDLSKTISKEPGEPVNTVVFGEEERGEVDFWMVVRDGRGGIGWCQDKVVVR